MIAFYRHSDKGKEPSDFGYSINKKDCFLSFYEVFKQKAEIIVFCDNSSEEIFHYFKKQKHISKVIQTNLGVAKNAIFVLTYALENYNDEIFYFAEDDYLYNINDPVELLIEGLNESEYVTLYDHGDKYSNFCKQPNALIEQLGEQTILFRTKSSHWKYTNSTTFTFAIKQETLKEDIAILNSFSEYNDSFPLRPADFYLFLHLRKVKNHRLACCIPGRATHLSPTMDNVSPFYFANCKKKLIMATNSQL